MILQIEKNRFIGDEKPLPTIYISDDNNRGCQFVAGFPNLQNNVIYYGNELGWSSPESFVCLVKEHMKRIINKQCTNDFQVIHYHKSTEKNISFFLRFMYLNLSSAK